MSQRILGLDVGHTSVKITVVETSFRNTHIVETYERVIPPALPVEVEGEGEDIPENHEGMLRVLRDLKNEGRLEADTIIASIPGEQAIYRFLDFPFTDAKQIESTVGFEFEGQVPFYLDELVYDYQIIESHDEGTRVLTVGAKLEEFEDLLNGLKSLELEPKMIGVGALVHANLLKMLGDEEGRTLLIDFGAARTDILLTNNGQMELARTIHLGGNEITNSISDLLGVGFAEAESLKQEAALVVPESTTLSDPQESRLVPAVRVGLAGLLRGITQSVERTLTAADDESRLDRILIIGGGAKLRGLPEYLSHWFGASAERLEFGSHAMSKLSPTQSSDGVHGKSLGLALKGSSFTKSGQVNFRKGQYSYAGDFQYLRDRALSIGFLLLLIVSVGFGRMYLKHDLLSAERDAQVDSLRELSKELLGKEKEDFDSVLNLLKKKPENADVTLIPAITAKQVFYDITTIMQEVNNASREEILALRGTDEEGGEASQEEPVPDEESGPTPSAPPNPAGKLAPSVPPGPGPNPPVLDTRDSRINRLRQARNKNALGIVNGPARAANNPKVLAPVVDRNALNAKKLRGLPTGLSNLRETQDARRAELEKMNAPPVPPPTADPAQPGTPEGEEPAEKEEEVRFVVELEAIQVDEGGANLKGEANSLEAATLLEQKLGKHRCFSNVVLEGTDKINFERHRGWRSFRIELDIACASKQDAKSKGGEK